MSKTASYDLRPLGIMPAGAAIQPGQVALANEDVFADTFFSQPMTDYAVGWASQQRWIRDLLDFLAPGVRTTRRFEYRVANNAKAFAAAENDKDIRALYGEFALVEAIGTIQNGRTLSKGLTTIIDKDDEQENPQIVQQKVAWLMDMLLRAEVIRAMALLNGAASNTAVTWGGQGGSNPDIDLNGLVLAGGNASGMDPNRIIIGGQAWQVRLNALASVNTAGGFQGYGMTPEQLASWLGIDRPGEHGAGVQRLRGRDAGGPVQHQALLVPRVRRRRVGRLGAGQVFPPEVDHGQPQVEHHPHELAGRPEAHGDERPGVRRSGGEHEEIHPHRGSGRACRGHRWSGIALRPPSAGALRPGHRGRRAAGGGRARLHQRGGLVHGESRVRAARV